MANGIGSKSVVLVHGLCTDGSVWRKVIPMLQAHGIQATAAQLPNHSLDEDMGVVRRLLDQQQGPVVLVGHSYAGMVISGSGKHESVTGLVYLAALAGDNDETVSYLMAEHAPAYHFEVLSDEAGGSWPLRDIFTAGMAPDADPADQELLWATRKPFGGVIFASTVGSPAWKQKPTWYLATTEDRILHIGTQRFLANRMNAKKKEIASDHMPHLSHPEEVVNMILEAVSAT